MGPCAQVVVADGDGESKQTRDLKGESREHDVVTFGGGVAFLGCDRGKATAGTLEGEGDEVTAYEDVGILLWL